MYETAVTGDLDGIDVGNNTSFTLTCLPPDTYFMSITAYDHDADGVDDWTDGNESWFSREIVVETTATPTCAAPSRPHHARGRALLQQPDRPELDR